MSPGHCLKVGIRMKLGRECLAPLLLPSLKLPHLPSSGLGSSSASRESRLVAAVQKQERVHATSIFAAKKLVFFGSLTLVSAAKSEVTSHLISSNSPSLALLPFFCPDCCQSLKHSAGG